MSDAFFSRNEMIISYSPFFSHSPSMEILFLLHLLRPKTTTSSHRPLHVRRGYYFLLGKIISTIKITKEQSILIRNPCLFLFWNHPNSFFDRDCTTLIITFFSTTDFFDRDCTTYKQESQISYDDEISGDVIGMSPSASAFSSEACRDFK